MSPSTGIEYSDAFRRELARNSSAAAQSLRSTSPFVATHEFSQSLPVRGFCVANSFYRDCLNRSYQKIYVMHVFWTNRADMQHATSRLGEDILFAGEMVLRTKNRLTHYRAGRWSWHGAV